jgi:hypothetical protein
VRMGPERFFESRSAQSVDATSKGQHPHSDVGPPSHSRKPQYILVLHPRLDLLSTRRSSVSGSYHGPRIILCSQSPPFCRPRLFAIHGLHEPGAILGWGMQFPDGQGAVYTDPETRTTHSASTAENVLLHLRVVGDVELTWLTSDAQ